MLVQCLDARVLRCKSALVGLRQSFSNPVSPVWHSKIPRNVNESVESVNFCLN